MDCEAHFVVTSKAGDTDLELRPFPSKLSYPLDLLRHDQGLDRGL